MKVTGGPMGDGGNGEAGDFVGAGSPTMFKGPTTALFATRDGSKDNGDGTVTLSFKVKSAEMPADLASSPENSIWEVTVTRPSTEVDATGDAWTLVGSRQTLKDAEGGDVVVRFAVFPGGVPVEALYGRRKESTTLSICLLAKENAQPFMQSAAQRHSVMQRAAMMTADAEFGPWIAERCRLARLPVLDSLPPVVEDEGGRVGPMDGAEYRTRRSLEHLYRVARIHSRTDVLGDNAAAGRLEDVLRSYRAHLQERNARLARRVRPED